MPDDRQHIGEIERVVLGGGSQRDAVVVESWRRCVAEHGLDPTRPQPAHIVTHGQLRAHRERAGRVIAIARTGIEHLFRQVAGQSYVLMLADAQGVTVDFFGDPSTEHDLRRAGLYLGAQWSEAMSGTSGIGCCIATGDSVVVHQTDHFDLTHTALSCTAAPIYDTSGALVAVLDISLLRSPEAKTSQRLALHLVSAAVRRIELANLMATMREHWVLRLAHSPDFLDVDPEAAVAVDGSGRIVGATHSATQLLARSAGDRVVGQPLRRFFTMDMEGLPTLLAGRPPEERLVYLGDGSALFGHAIAPFRRVEPVRVPSRLPAPMRELAGPDPRVHRLLDRAARLADGQLPVLVRGETGSGKERLARAMHAARSTPGPFVTVNCAAIPESLVEGELFGHAPGAFSGALRGGRAGLVEAADGGVLFLDEIGDMPLSLQARLLRVLSEGEVTRVGEVTPRRVRVKVISATHRDLRAMVEAGTFRTDLFFRLAAATLDLPPLRQRADFDWLLQRMLADRAPAGQPAPLLTDAARDALARRRWPGNLRELGNTLDVAITLARSPIIDEADLPDPVLGEPGGATGGSDEAEALAQLLAEHDWCVAQVARALGVDRTTVHRRIRRLGLERPS